MVSRIQTNDLFTIYMDNMNQTGKLVKDGKSAQCKKNMMDLKQESLAVSYSDSDPCDSYACNGQVVGHVPYMLVRVGLKYPKKSNCF